MACLLGPEFSVPHHHASNTLSDTGFQCKPYAYFWGENGELEKATVLLYSFYHIVQVITDQCLYLQNNFRKYFGHHVVPLHACGRKKWFISIFDKCLWNAVMITIQC